MLFKILKKAILTVCFFLCSLVYSQEYSVTSQNNSHYHELITGNFDLFSSTPDTPFDQYVFIYQSTFQQVLLETISIQTFEERFEATLESIKLVETSSPYHLFFEAEIRILAAIVYFKSKQQLDAGWQLRQSYKAIQRNESLFPEFLPTYKTLGFLQMALGAVPEKYHWLLSVAGMKGSISEGIKNLRLSIERDTIYSRESTYLLALGHTYLLGNTTKGVEVIKSVSKSTPLDALIRMSLLAKNNQGQEVLDLSYKIDTMKVLPQTFYLMAEANFQQGDYEKAQNLYLKFIATHAGNTNKLDTYFKLSLCAHFLNNPDRKENYLAKAIKLEPHSAVDKNASSLIQDLKSLNYSMLQVRMATDGGFYNRAENIMNKIKLSNKKDSVEFTYRKARLTHKQDNLHDAIELYKATIQTTGKESWYFAPNSALNLGLIHEQKNNLDDAMNYYQLAKSYKHHVYKNSIDSKAEVGISRIKDLLNE